MAKYKEYENRLERLRQQKADLPIAISEEEFAGEDKDKIEYICKHCGRSLVKIDEEGGGEWYCNHCSISQFPDVEEVRSKHKLLTPIGLNLEPCLSYLPDPSDKKPQIKGGLKALQDKGIRITSYTETGEDGRMRKRRITWD